MYGLVLCMGLIRSAISCLVLCMDLIRNAMNCFVLCMDLIRSAIHTIENSCQYVKYKTWTEND